MKLLQENGAEIGVCDEFNTGVVDYAAERGNVAIMGFLLQMKCDVNIVTSNCRQSPLFIAVENGHLEIVEILIAAGANLENEVSFHFVCPRHM